MTCENCGTERVGFTCPNCDGKIYIVTNQLSEEPVELSGFIEKIHTQKGDNK